ncbi:MAG: outer membrane beta-barrel protein [Alphaproteobacteria bacterium]|nr:outer membrane beta-barrel protein [Alphaproteobacteria bacterium]
MRSLDGKILIAAIAVAVGCVTATAPAHGQTSTPAVTPGVSPGVNPAVRPGVRRAVQPGVQLPSTPPPTFQQPTVEPQRGETVTTRPRPDFDPVGIRWRDASAFIYPSFSYTQLFDTNVFADEDDTIGDHISIFSPGVQVLSDWTRHEANINFRADLGRYIRERTEDYQDVLAEATGRYDITGDSNVFGGLRWARRHEDRGSPDEVRGEFPTIFFTLEPQIGYFQRLNRWTFRVDGNARKFDFRDATTPFGKINNDDRDRTEYLGAATVSYEIIPNYDAFLQFSGNVRDYKTNVDDFGVDKDSDGFEIVGGTAVDLTGLLFGNIFAGYRRQEYDDGRLPTIEGPSFGVDLTWTPTGLTTVKAFVNRTIEETTTFGNAGFFATRAGASVDHELLRNLLLSARGSGQFNRYEGTDRDDDIYRAAANARYFLNRNFYVTGGYEFTRRDSNVSGASFNIHLFLLRLEAQL